MVSGTRTICRTSILRGMLAAGLAACSPGSATETLPLSPVRSVVVHAPTLPLTIGNHLTLTATALDGAGNVVDTATIKWSSTSATVATISAEGILTGVAAGTTSIIAQGGNVTAAATVTVTAAPLATLIVTGPPDSQAVGATVALRIVGIDANGIPVVAPVATWSTNNPTVATVSSTGVVTPLARGAATITATAGALTASVTVLVKGVPIAHLGITGLPDVLLVGARIGITAVALDSAGRPVQGLPITWFSSAPLVATITGAGIITALAPGQTTITVTAGGLTATAVVRVGIPAIAASITLVSPADSLDIGNYFEVPVTAYDSNGTRLATPALSWTSSSPAIATVSANGVITALLPGSATITAQSGAATASIVVHVRGNTAVSIMPAGEFLDTIHVSPGQGLQFSAYKYYTGSLRPTLTPDAPATWSSTVPGVATVNATGLVTGISAGTTTIITTMDNLSATRNVRVTSTPGSTAVRLINAADEFPSVTMRPGGGTPALLNYGDISEQTVPAGTFQLSADGFPPNAPYFDPSLIELQSFFGFVPADQHSTFIAIGSNYTPPWPGPISIAWIYDRIAPVPADSAVVRVVLATTGGYNVYFAPTGAAVSLLFLQGCYLDWPFGYTGYSDRVPGDFDIVLQLGKGITGPESARFHVTPAPGHATTYIITGKNSASLGVITVVDR